MIVNVTRGVYAIQHCASGRGWLQAVAAIVLAFVAAFAGPHALAGSMEREVEFHIAPGSLESALLEFSKQADLPITVAPHVVSNLQTSGLTGRLTIGAALQNLLRDEGLSYALIGDTVAITRARAPARASPSQVSLKSAGDASRSDAHR